jgi:EAL domain-containing protein (putative c-di-GMP-specific phosphodiesterase class I)
MIRSNLKSYFRIRMAGVLLCLASLLFFNPKAKAEDIILFSADVQTLDLTTKLHPVATARTELTLDVLGSDPAVKDHIDLVASRQGAKTTWYLVTLKNDSKVERNAILSLQDSNITAVFASAGLGKIKVSSDEIASFKLSPSATITLALESTSAPKHVLLQDRQQAEASDQGFSLFYAFAFLAFLVAAIVAIILYFPRKSSQRFQMPSHSLDAVDDSSSSASHEGGDPYGSITNDFHQALELGQFDTCFHPIFGLNDRKIIGVEAAIQWHHPVYGILAWPYIASIAPNDPILEELDQLLMEIAISQIGEWNRQNVTRQPFNLVINVAGLGANEISFCERLTHLASRAGLSRSSVTIQVQCASLVYHRETAQQFANQIKLQGFNFSGGNFGWGGADLLMLRNFAFDHLSLDASFIENNANERRSHTFLKATVDYLRSLGNKVSVTGITDETARRNASLLGCEQGQGFPFDFALTTENLLEFLSSNLSASLAAIPPNPFSNLRAPSFLPEQPPTRQTKLLFPMSNKPLPRSNTLAASAISGFGETPQFKPIFTSGMFLTEAPVQTKPAAVRKKAKRKKAKRKQQKPETQELPSNLITFGKLEKS